MLILLQSSVGRSDTHSTHSLTHFPFSLFCLFRVQREYYSTTTVECVPRQSGRQQCGSDGSVQFSSQSRVSPPPSIPTKKSNGGGGGGGAGEMSSHSSSHCCCYRKRKRERGKGLPSAGDYIFGYCPTRFSHHTSESWRWRCAVVCLSAATEATAESLIVAHALCNEHSTVALCVCMCVMWFQMFQWCTLS